MKTKCKQLLNIGGSTGKFLSPYHQQNPILLLEKVPPTSNLIFEIEQMSLENCHFKTDGLMVLQTASCFMKVLES